MATTACSDCGRTLELTAERHLRLSGDGPTGDAAAILCIDCGTARLNSDPSLPAGAVEVHAPTGPRR